PIVKRCLQGMAMEDQGKPEEAEKLFLQAWQEATDDFEKFLSAHFVARHHPEPLKWLSTTLQFAIQSNDESARTAIPTLYSNLAKYYEELGDHDEAKKNFELATSFSKQLVDHGPFYHGTKADLQIGDFLTAGLESNYKADLIMNHIYFTAMM